MWHKFPRLTDVFVVPVLKLNSMMTYGCAVALKVLPY